MLRNAASSRAATGGEIDVDDFVHARHISDTRRFVEKNAACVADFPPHRFAIMRGMITVVACVSRACKRDIDALSKTVVRMRMNGALRAVDGELQDHSSAFVKSR